MAEVPDNKMVVYPAGGLVITERFRILRHFDDLIRSSPLAVVEEAKERMQCAIEDFLDTEDDPDDETITALVSAAALLIVAADRLILARVESGAGS